MKPTRIAGFIVLGLVWLWLVWAILSRSEINLITIFWIVASAIIIFLPMWRKYGPDGSSGEDDKPKRRNNSK